MLYVDLKITDPKVFSNIISSDFNKKVGGNLPKIASKVKPQVSKIISDALYSSPTTQSLLSGSLRDDFGLYGNVANITINNIIKHFSENIELNIKSGGKNMAAVILIDVMPSNFETVAKLPVGYFLSSKQRPVPWLDWLITKGTQVVVGDFWMYDNAKGRTRSGGNKVMIPIGRKAKEPFRVDPSHAGTIDDNFITRALDPVADDIIRIIAAEFIRSA